MSKVVAGASSSRELSVISFRQNKEIYVKIYNSYLPSTVSYFGIALSFY